MQGQYRKRRWQRYKCKEGELFMSLLNLTLYQGAKRARFNHGWLQSQHTFSFGEFYDPSRMGFHSLRVINEDKIAPGTGFPTHSHKNMEIITFMIDGVLEHKDSMGHTAQIKPGEIQYMSAGSGVTHSEFNASAQSPAHLLQIWIETNLPNAKPQYKQTTFSLETRGIQKLVGTKNVGISFPIRQETSIHLLQLQENETSIINFEKDPWIQETGNHFWLQVAQGEFSVNDKNQTTIQIESGDALHFSKELNDSSTNDSGTNDSMTFKGTKKLNQILIFQVTEKN
jgi:quercetin 2,3-dioxygenase